MAVQYIVSLPMKGTSSSGALEKGTTFPAGSVQPQLRPQRSNMYRSSIGMIGQVDEFLQLAW